MSERTAGNMNVWGLVGAAALVVGLVLMGSGCAFTPKAGLQEGIYAESRSRGASDNTDVLADIALFHLGEHANLKRAKTDEVTGKVMERVKRLRNPELAATEAWDAAVLHTRAHGAIDAVEEIDRAVIESRRAAGYEYADDAKTVFEMQEKARRASNAFWGETISQGFDLGGRIYAQHQAEQARREQEKKAEEARKALEGKERELAEREKALEHHQPEPAPMPTPEPATPVIP